MKIPIIRIKDGLSEKEHIVGFESYDKLYIDDNAIKYENTLNQSNTDLNECLFVGNRDNQNGEVFVEMVSLEEYFDMILAKLSANSEKHKELSKIKADYLRAEEEEQAEIEEAMLLLGRDGNIVDINSVLA